MAVPRSRSRRRPPRRALILSGGGARGAYQAGVLRYLREVGWEPDLICGTSVGAINAVALGCGLDIEDIVALWRSIERQRIYRISLIKQFQYLLFRRGFVPLMETEPLRGLIMEQIDLGRLRTSPSEVIITAVNILQSRLKFFDNSVIGIDHVMASSAIPIFFPWQYIDGEPYWDGGVMANTPVLPALERGVKEIIVVLLSPVGGTRMGLPAGRRQAVERVFEQALIGSYQAFLSHLAFEERLRGRAGFFERLRRRTFAMGDVRIVTVAPERMLGFRSLLDFSGRQADGLLSAGYSDARLQLFPFFNGE